VRVCVHIKSKNDHVVWREAATFINNHAGMWVIWLRMVFEVKFYSGRLKQTVYQRLAAEVSPHWWPVR
jgi:hypothetical protein